MRYIIQLFRTRPGKSPERLDDDESGLQPSQFSLEEIKTVAKGSLETVALPGQKDWTGFVRVVEAREDSLSFKWVSTDNVLFEKHLPSKD